MNDIGGSRSAGAPLDARYRILVEEGRLQFDPAQLRVAEILQDCRERLNETERGWFRRRLLSKMFRAPVPSGRVDGVYLHGGVGRGKTLLMDLFVQALEHDGIAVERAHFHRFMDGVHASLKDLGNRVGPLAEIAAEQRRRGRVLCFDEFHVEDIVDAMILGELTSQWFQRGLTLVATSNQAPSGLYAGGLQRTRFEPAIANLERHCRVVELDAARDFRLRELERHPTWYTPLGERTERQLAEEFDALSPDQPAVRGPLVVRGRALPIRMRAGSLLWADFSDLCEGPRGSGDYIELACRFSTLIVSNIPRLDDDRNNAARRFMHLVDECYDRSVKVVASSECPIDEVYRGKWLAGGFRRTVSRLVEMQSHEYLARPHRP